MLKSSHGIAISKIADAVGVPSSRIVNIRRGKSSATKDMIATLKEAYPLAFAQQEELKVDALRERMDRLEAENQAMRKVLLKVAADYMAAEDAERKKKEVGN